MLVKIGFKEIEVGFPAASQTDFDFVREIIEEELVPDGVTIQVLTQARPELIARTCRTSLPGRAARDHAYLPIRPRPLQRRVVFRCDRAGIIDAIAVRSCHGRPRERASLPPTRNGFSSTARRISPARRWIFAVEVCDAVNAVWEPTARSRKTILNLPATVEMATPNVYADQIEVVRP